MKFKYESYSGVDDSATFEWMMTDDTTAESIKSNQTKPNRKKSFNIKHKRIAADVNGSCAFNSKEFILQIASKQFLFGAWKSNCQLFLIEFTVFYKFG